MLETRRKTIPRLRAGEESGDTHGPYRVAAFQTFLSSRIRTFGDIPVLPVAAFEVENKTGLKAKPIKGSVSNLNNAGAQVGVSEIGGESLLLHVGSSRLS